MMGVWIMYFVEINRETIRLNPKYEKWLRELGEGEKDKDKLREELEEVLPKRVSIHLVTDHNVLKVEELKNDLTLCGYVCSGYVLSVDEDGVNVCIDIPHCDDLEDFKEKLARLSWDYGFVLKGVSVDTDADNLYRFDCVPDKYLYDYKPLEVTCEYCGRSFDHSKIVSDYDYYDLILHNVCPFCHESNCVDIEYEELNEEDYNRLGGVK